MDEAWVAMTIARDIVDYVGDGLVIAIDNYTETERNAVQIAAFVDPLLAFSFGNHVAFLSSFFGPLSIAFPWLVRGKFEGDGKAVGARDVEFPGWVNALLSDPANVTLVRGMVMNGDLVALGLGGVPAVVAAQLKGMGLNGVALSGTLLTIYARGAGMLNETGVNVTRSTDYTREGPAVSSTLDTIAAIPDPAIRADGAQIRIDVIREGDSVRYQVFIAGTNDFNPISKSEPFDSTSNVAGVAGESPASYRAVQLAMEQAGITADSEVAFAGYSQGGLIATMLAASGDYTVKGLTTIGAPAGQIIVQPDVPALIIEHYEDMVPALGGTQANTDAVLVRRHAFSDERPADPDLAMPGHQLQYYLETAELIDSAESEKLNNTVEQLNAFSAADSVTSTWYVAERTP
jgi:hypothetical protein